jgi:hypothetical protein
MYNAGRLYDEDVMWGYSNEGKGALTIAFVKTKDGNVEGRLLSDDGVQTLTLHPPDESWRVSR